MDWDAQRIIWLAQWIIALIVAGAVLYELATGRIRSWDFGTARRIVRREEPSRYWRLMALHIFIAAVLLYFAID